ncbi:MATE family efflux transporter [Dickeya dianthicola]|uniref:Multidrug-efflux transporter n=1 Tax=Dickeya dianthicola TaxID=204039 RepID=A0ABX9NLV2_9GAMM|nr:MATE family efflux transporter [Dickeya dianthicola]MCI4029854.1 MATE family efflux transporter [Dickeya dianthicola]MCI4070792.1 MATE family efflux transporter [Dickeya dianthicola]MCI4116146.1 MATE family efflux transporter [Dickeya dianthicola]MCI4121100.1 MATE family efflux transporter [Dickeya dianthicola]MCI4125535.1 MATE family efflux transporter [Dickeya dianthicola]
MKDIVEKPNFKTHARDLIAIAVPIAISLLAQKVVNVTDAVMLGGLGPEELGAGVLATTVFFTIMTLMHGVMSGLTVLLSHARGSGKYAEIPKLYGSALLLAVLLSIPLFIAMSNLETILLFAGTERELARNAGYSAAVLRWGAPGALLGLSLMRAFMPAVGGARVLLVVSVLVMLINAALNHAFIYGFWLLPAMGYVGSAAATSTTITLSAICLLWVAHRSSRYRTFTKELRADFKIIRQILNIGCPVSITLGVEAAVFLVAGLSLSSFDPAALPAHQIAFSIVDTIFAVPLALANAANVRLSFWSGAKRPAEVKKSGTLALSMGAAFMLIASAILWLMPQKLVGFYIDNSQSTNYETVKIAMTLLGIASLFMLGDGIQSIASGCLRALKDTKIPMVLSTIGYWGIAFPFGQWLAHSQHMGAKGIWIGLATGISASAMLLTIRFYILSRRFFSKLSYI